jgi:hypothetical protein
MRMSECGSGNADGGLRVTRCGLRVTHLALWGLWRNDECRMKEFYIFL